MNKARPIRNILYAEDDPDDAVIFQLAFQRAALPHQLRYVENGEQAIAWLEGGGPFADREKYPLPEILILDLKMPRKTGFDVLKWVRQSEKFAALPVIILSSSDDAKDIQQAHALGAATYFVKSSAYEDVIDYLQMIP